ncbi:HlyD family efflux transporter periplasmic adaptor subunit [Pseudosulfitobacter pseudonitzschiae]|uniref:HlyD family efflux transporter periplasmic adaptor subunit n=1 Tax=Pseudosulfitobacter pseudonitzschiae TaxID=1402135 RepID=UPI0037CB0656
MPRWPPANPPPVILNKRKSPPPPGHHQPDRKPERRTVPAAGTGIAQLVDNSHTWVEANFKETQLADLSRGQPVTIEVDAYPAWN